MNAVTEWVLIVVVMPAVIGFSGGMIFCKVESWYLTRKYRGHK